MSCSMLLLGLSLGAPTEDTVSTTTYPPERRQGGWYVVRFEFGERKYERGWAHMTGENLRLVLRPTREGPRPRDEEFEWPLRWGPNHGEFDLHGSLKGIYEFDGIYLDLCWSNKRRPTDFSSGPDRVRLILCEKP